MREVNYHADVGDEVIRAAVYYERQCEGLGSRFLDDYDNTVSDIAERPSAWPPLDAQYRRHQLRHFPYGIISGFSPTACAFSRSCICTGTRTIGEAVCRPRRTRPIERTCVNSGQSRARCQGRYPQRGIPTGLADSAPVQHSESSGPHGP